MLVAVKNVFYISKKLILICSNIFKNLGNLRTHQASVVPNFCSRTFHHTGGRTALPAPCADNSHIGIMTILYNNIGKDLSRVSMPVALNEPLSLLQRLSEELEYSDLLDIANHIEDPYERMVRFLSFIGGGGRFPKRAEPRLRCQIFVVQVYVAAFSISGYAWASWRYRYKPFNPVLGETYESHREDRGFHYVSEQVMTAEEAGIVYRSIYNLKIQCVKCLRTPVI